MEGNVSGFPGMIVLNSQNYSDWKIRMEDLLIVKDLYEPIERETIPRGVIESEWKMLHRKAVATIRQCVDISVLQHVASDTNAFELWHKLSALYESKNALNTTFLVRKIVNLKYVDGESIVEHISTFMGLVNQLASAKFPLEDAMQATLLLCTLPDSWENLIVTLSNSCKEDNLSLKVVKTSILNEETRRKDKGALSQSEANVTQELSGERSTHRSPETGNRFYARSKSRGRLTCFYCGKPGHFQKNCRHLRKDKGMADEVESGKISNDKNTSAIATSEEEMLYICEQASVNLANAECSWIVDSGASFHLTPKRECFSSYIAGDYGYVRMGNDGECKIVGIGNVCLLTSTGCRLILKDVRHVPDVRLNLISAGRLDDEGYSGGFRNGTWKFYQGSRIVARAQKQNTLYVMHAKLCRDEANIVGDSNGELWHRRLGHMSERGMHILAEKEFLPDIKGIHLERCVDCLAGKQNRTTFHSRPPMRREHALELVHTDVCYVDAPSHRGGQYFVTFIDDFSRKVWAFVLTSKDQVLSVFKEFHARVERESGQKLKAVRTDNGGEYRGQFEMYCKIQGIKLQYTVPKTPELNGLAERMNRTIMERVRSMLSHAKLPKSYWAEAMLTAVYLINRSPSMPLKGDIPQRVWTGRSVSYQHLRVFGCLAYVHVAKDQRSKLDSKSKPCIFLGYSEDEFGYRMWDLLEKKVIRSRDIIFMEDKTFEDWRQQQPKMFPQPTTTIEPTLVEPISTLPVGVQQPAEEVESELVDTRQQADAHESESDDEVVEEIEFEPAVEGSRYPRRQRKTSSRYPASQYILLTDEGEPECYEEAMTDVNKEKWYNAMQEEMDSLHENHTYELMELPDGKKALRNKWVYKLKTGEDKNTPRYKARIVVKGFQQKKGVDFDEIFAPVVKMTSIRTVLSMAANMNLEIEQLDVKTAFLHGELEEEIYMQQPEGFETKGKENLVCRLRKSLYGLKQAPRQWYKKFESFMLEHGFHKTQADHCVFVKRYDEGDFLILLLYVDDMLVVGQNAKKIASLKKELSKVFAMKDLGPAKQMLGMHIVRDRTKNMLWLSQEKYVAKVLQRFNMINANFVGSPLPMNCKLNSEQCPKTEKDKAEMRRVPYASAVGSLMYAMVCTRPDIAFAVGTVSRYMSNPGKEHWDAVKWILRYLKGTPNVCLRYGVGKPLLEGFTDSDMSGDADSSRSTSGYVMTYSGGAVSWQSRLQKVVALSTTEAEYMAAVEAGKELIWMRDFLNELGVKQEEFLLHCDNQSAIHLAKNAAYHSRTKHIQRRYHWLRERVEENEFVLTKIHTNENGSDMLTKVLSFEKIVVCRQRIGLVDSPPLQE
jgi:transposase InsO family protein